MIPGWHYTPLSGNCKLFAVVILKWLPHSFHPTDENKAYLRRLRAGFGDLPLVVELRNAGWVTDETFEFLSSSACHMALHRLTRPAVRDFDILL